MSKKIAVIVGSLRKASWSRKIALALIERAPASLEMDIVEINQLPLYNEDLENAKHIPQAWTDFREKMKTMDGVIFVTPEYNRSVPAALKNAIDVGSRPYGKSIWNNKPGAIVSVSPGAIAGFGANHHLRQCLVFLNIPCMQQPEAYIGGVTRLFDENLESHQIINPETDAFLRSYIETYAAWVIKLS